MSVAGFTARSDGRFDVKICTSSPYKCEISNGFYRLKNPDSTGTYLQFPSTLDNKDIFIPARVVEDKDAFKSLVMDNLKTKPSCLDISPCDVFVDNVCCSSGSSDNSVLVLVLAFVLMGMILIGALALVYYLLKSD